MIPLQAVTPEELFSGVGEISLEEARRIIGAIYRHDDLPCAIRNVRRASLERVRASGEFPSLAIRSVESSAVDPFVKYSLESPLGHAFEAVRIPLEKPGRFSVCVSSQAGCALGCAFCATGRMGLLRNLQTWEIIEQVRLVRRTLDRQRGERVRGIVFQGMGEPLANLDAVIAAVRVACEPSGLAVDARAITVCTAGLPGGIVRLGQELPAVRLAVSIGSTFPDVRLRLMPIQKSYPLDEVLEAAAEHSRHTRLAPMWAITLLEGINDGEKEALRLAALAREFEAKSGRRPRISILAYNPIDEPVRDAFRRVPPEVESAFRDVLSAAGLPSHRRYSGGGDVRAACGQLATDRERTGKTR